MEGGRRRVVNIIVISSFLILFDPALVRLTVQLSSNNIDMWSTKGEGSSLLDSIGFNKKYSWALEWSCLIALDSFKLATDL